MHHSIASSAKPLFLLCTFNPASRSLLLVAFGALAGLAFAPLYCWPAIPLSWIALFKTMDTSKHTIPATVKPFFMWCFGFFLVSFYWVSFSISADFTRLWFMLPLSFLGIPFVLALLHTVVLSFFLLFFQQHNTNNNFAFVLTFYLSWICSEWLREALPLPQLPWNFLAHSWGGTSAIMQSTSLFGVYTLSFLTCGFFLLPALWRAPKDRQHRKIKTYTTAGFLLVFFLIAVWGHFRPTTLDYHPHVFMRIVQPNIPAHEKLRGHAFQRIHFLKLTRLTKQPSTETLTHILWPEAAFSLFISSSEIVPFKPPVNDNQILIAGLMREEKDKVFNSLFVLSSLGYIQSVYDKKHLAPFGEYIPGRTFLEKLLPKRTLKAVTMNTQDFSAGEGAQSLALRGAPSFYPLICFDTAFNKPYIFKPNRPQWFLETTNDAWFKNSWALYQHLDLARFKAIEYGLPLVRTTNTGVSALISPYGEILEKLPVLEEGILDFKLPKPLSYTLFQKVHHSFFITGLCVLFIVLLWLTATRKTSTFRTTAQKTAYSQKNAKHTRTIRKK